MSEKVQLMERLLSLAERLIYTPQAQQETPKEKEIKTAVSAIKDLADVAVRLQAHEAQLGALVERVDQELGRLRALVALSVIASIAAILLAVLFR